MAKLGKKQKKYYNTIRQIIKEMFYYFKAADKRNIIFKKITVLIFNISVASLYFSYIIYYIYKQLIQLLNKTIKKIYLFNNTDIVIIMLGILNSYSHIIEKKIYRY